jgi:Tfp pilus assembly protein PilV
MSVMKQTHEQGNTLVIVVLVLLLVGVSALAVWAYQGRQDYKDNTDQKIIAAVAAAKREESIAKDKQFAEKEKQPLRLYNGPAAYGSLLLSYPRTWSGYVDDTGRSGSVVDGYFAKGVVPSVTNESSTFALRLQVLSQSYSQVVNGFSNLQKSGKVTVAPYALPKVSSVVGVRVKGEVRNETVDMVVLPLRDKTLQLWTEGTQFENDFNNNILANFSFSP